MPVSGLSVLQRHDRNMRFLFRDGGKAWLPGGYRLCKVQKAYLFEAAQAEAAGCSELEISKPERRKLKSRMEKNRVPAKAQ